MQTRTKLALLILFGLLLLLLGLWLIWQTYRSGSPAADDTTPYQETMVRNSADKSGGNQPAVSGTGVPAATTTTRQKPPEDKLRTLEDEARAAVERIGSGTSQDGFLGYGDVIGQATPAFQAWLSSEQAKLRAAHASTGPLWVISTRGVASHVQSGALGDATINIKVQAIQESGSKAEVRAGKQILVTMAKQADGSYLIDKMEWSELPL